MCFYPTLIKFLQYQITFPQKLRDHFNIVQVHLSQILKISISTFKRYFFEIHTFCLVLEDCMLSYLFIKVASFSNLAQHWLKVIMLSVVTSATHNIIEPNIQRILKEVSITVLLTSCLTGLESAV
jgi:hypothetical protein